LLGALARFLDQHFMPNNKAEFFIKPDQLEDRPYNPSAMGRRLTKTRPKQGVRLAELRKAAGLSQYELARMVGVPQANIAFWERSEKPPRSDVLPKMADALGVRVEDLLNESAVTQKLRAGKSKPVGKVRQVFEEVSKLPRRQQDKVVEFVTAFVRHYQQTGRTKLLPWNSVVARAVV
jgi:transcriptional regulator with XRE-family HTH domain